MQPTSMMVFLRDSVHIFHDIPELKYKMSAQPHYEIDSRWTIHMINVLC